MGNNLLDYVVSEKDLGITIFLLYNKANQRFGLLKRTCHLIIQKKKSPLLMRSMFEHCPAVWRPPANTTTISLKPYKNVPSSGLIKIIAPATVLMIYYTMFIAKNWKSYQFDIVLIIMT